MYEYLKIIKKLVLIIMLAFPYYGLQAQEQYNVYWVIGNIRRAADGLLLKPQMHIRGDEKILFESKNAAAFLKDTKNGTYVLRAGNNSRGKISGVLQGLVANYIGLSKKYCDTRAAGFRNPIDFENYFKDTIAVIGDTLRLNISETSFPMSKSLFFYIRHKSDGEILNTELDYINNDLLLTSDKVCLKKDGNDDDSKILSGSFMLFYYDQNSEISRLMSETGNVKFVPYNEFQEMLNTYLSSEKDNTKSIEKIKDDIFEIVLNLYGSPDKQNLTECLLKNIKTE